MEESEHIEEKYVVCNNWWISCISLKIKELYSKIKIKESVAMLHEAYCARNRTQCLKCGLFIEKKELEFHEENAHSLVIDITNKNRVFC